MVKILLINFFGSILVLGLMTAVLYVVYDIQGRLEFKRLLEAKGEKVRFRDIH